MKLYTITEVQLLFDKLQRINCRYETQGPIRGQWYDLNREIVMTVVYHLDCYEMELIDTKMVKWVKNIPSLIEKSNA